MKREYKQALAEGGQRMKQDATQGQWTKTQAGRHKNMALVHPPHEVDSAQSKDCDLGEKQDQQAINGKSGRVRQHMPKCWSNWPNSPLTNDDVPWLACGFLAMAEHAIIALMQAIFLLTFPWGLQFLLSWTKLFSWQLEHQAPSQHPIHCKPYHQCQLPRKTSSKVQKKKRLREKLARGKGKMSVIIYLFLWSIFPVGCCIKNIIRQTNVTAQQAFLCCIVAT